MSITVRSFAKINLGLTIGPLRPDGFHDLRTVYQTIALHDIIHVQVERGAGIEIRCEDPRVPKDVSNTCYRIVERAMEGLRARGRVTITIEKRLPVQGGLGAGSGNAVTALIGLERVLKRNLPGAARLRIAEEVGSDLPLFLIGGTVLGVGRGEQVYPMEDLPALPCVVVTPEVGVSTPKAFADWDRLCGAGTPFDKLRAGSAREAVPQPRASKGRHPHPGLAHPTPKLTLPQPSDRMIELGRAYSAWLSEPYSGAPFGRGRAENPLLELVRAGIKNDFEEVVFPEYPELCEGKRALDLAGAKYASLSGSGSTLYGLFATRQAAVKAVARLRKQGWKAEATTTLTRSQYWRQIFDC